MPKRSLLYASPFPPQESGIADYSAALIHGLRTHYDITLYTENYRISDSRLAAFPVKRHAVDAVNIGSYDHVLYHIGNNPWYHAYIYEACRRHPGTVVLHETVLYYLFVGIYQDRPDFYTRLFATGGPEAVAAVKTMVKRQEPLLQFSRPADVPLNGELLRSPNRFLVHSGHAQRAVEEVSGGAACVRRVQLAQGSITSPAAFDRSAALSAAGIPANAVVIASFGFVAPTKLNEAICRAVLRVNETGAANLYYLMVGAGDYVARYTGEHIRITGYVPETDYDAYIYGSDLVFNLRYPTMGETSAAVLRAMWAGRPCVVCDIGWFSELPDDAVLKLDVGGPGLIEEEVYETLNLFLRNRRVFERLGEAGAAYVRREHSVESVADSIRRHLEQPCLAL